MPTPREPPGSKIASIQEPRTYRGRRPSGQGFGAQKASMSRFCAYSDREPVPAFAEYARFPGRSAGFQPSYKRRNPRRHHVATQVPARTEEFAENPRRPLFAGYFCLNEHCIRADPGTRQVTFQALILPRPDQRARGCGRPVRLGAYRALALWFAAGLAPAAAQGRLEAQYEATLAGIPVGKGAWTIEIGDDSFRPPPRAAPPGC